MAEHGIKKIMATLDDIQKAIKSAFVGVKLDGGVSLNQAKEIDKYGENISAEEFSDLPKRENTTDWKNISDGALEPDPCVAHFDAKGLRYYLPRLMLSVLTNYDSSSMRVIGTLQALYPKSKSWEYYMERYSALNDQQRKAIALFVESLPSLIELGQEDQVIMKRALERYWGQYL